MDYILISSIIFIAYNYKTIHYAYYINNEISIFN